MDRVLLCFHATIHNYFQGKRGLCGLITCPVIQGDSHNNRKTPAATSPGTLSTLNFPVSGEWHSELLHPDTECKNPLHILLTSHYKLTDMPRLLERTGSPLSPAHLSRQSSQSLLCATQTTKILLGHALPCTSPSDLPVLAARFCPLRPPPVLLLASSIFYSFAAPLSCFTPFQP